MALKLMNLAKHGGLPEKFPQPPLDYQFRDRGQKIEGGSNAANYKHGGEEPASRAERLNVAEPHGRDGADGHVKSVDRRHPLNKHIAKGAQHG